MTACSKENRSSKQISLLHDSCGSDWLQEKQLLDRRFRPYLCADGQQFIVSRK